LGIIAAVFVTAIVVKAAIAAYNLHATAQLTRPRPPRPRPTPKDYDDDVDRHNARRRQRKSDIEDFKAGVRGIVQNAPGTSITGPPTPPTKAPEIIVDVVTGCASKF
jgi:hypothetical protein